MHNKREKEIKFIKISRLGTLHGYRKVGDVIFHCYYLTYTSNLEPCYTICAGRVPQMVRYKKINDNEKT